MPKGFNGDKPMTKLEWQQKRIKDLEHLLSLVSELTIRFHEDVGQGNTDITERSVQSWNLQIEELRKSIMEDADAQRS